MIVTLNPASVDDYRMFCKIKTLPVWKIQGRQAWFPDEYAKTIGIKAAKSRRRKVSLSDSLFDYQRDISRLAINRQKYCVFADCGLGKTLIMLEFAKHAARSLPKSKRVLVVSPLMVVEQTLLWVRAER